MTKRAAKPNEYSFPRKRLLVRGDASNISHNETIDLILEEFKERIRTCKTRIQNGNLDAPDMSSIIYLGKINDTNPPIFKVNVPGWIYRFSPAWSTRTTASDYGVDYAKGKTGILLSYDPQYLMNNGGTNKANRILYMTAWDGQECSNANAMYPINPGSSTYMYITRDTTIKDTDAAFKEFYFIPTRLAISMNIHPNEYITKVGEPEIADLQLVDRLVSYVDNDVIKKIFDGKFTDVDSRGHMKNFAAIRGWMRVRRDLIKFVDNNSSYATSFYSSHPESQIENDDYEDFWRYGWLAAKMNYTTGVAAIAKEDQSTSPWETRAISSSTIAVHQYPTTLSGKKGAFSETAKVIFPDGLTMEYSGYTIAYYAEMWAVAGYTYKFSGNGTTTAVVAIDKNPVYTMNSSSKNGSWTATKTGWIPITIAHYSKTGDATSGGSLVLNVADSANKAVYKNIIVGNDVDRQLFRLPSVITNAKYRWYNRFQRVKQLLV